jgi:hypothetical protein
MKLEKFEQEYQEEINHLRVLSVKKVEAPDFRFPSVGVVYRRAISFAFAVPAFVVAFGLFFYNSNNSLNNQNLAMLEESNARILSEINSLDYEEEI